jgi:hypothetical protein
VQRGTEGRQSISHIKERREYQQTYRIYEGSNSCNSGKKQAEVLRMGARIRYFEMQPLCEAKTALRLRASFCGYACKIFEGFDVGAWTVQTGLLRTIHRVLLLQRVSCVRPFALNPSMIPFLPSDAAYAPAQGIGNVPVLLSDSVNSFF